MRTVPVLILLCAMHGAAAAAEPPPAAAACIECHAREYQRTSVPQLEGQHAAYLRMELTHFREKHRRAFPMDQIAQDLDDADIEALVTGTEVIPRTAGQNPVYLARQLRAFSRGDRYHPPTGTGARMFRLSEAEVESLALFLAQMPAP